MSQEAKTFLCSQPQGGVPGFISPSIILEDHTLAICPSSISGAVFTLAKSKLGKKGYFGSHFQVTVHCCRKVMRQVLEACHIHSQGQKAMNSAFSTLIKSSRDHGS